MILNNINVINFRNYRKHSISFSPGINVIIGDNAQGKTNILESIYVLAITKSYRTNNDINLIKFNEDLFVIKGNIKTNSIIKDLQLSFNGIKKYTKINSKQIKRISDYITNFNVILFAPEDLEIIKGSPSIRRNLLNIDIGQINRSYVNTLNEFNKILKSRNDYLKMMLINSYSDDRYLNILTDSLIEREIPIYMSRFNFVNKINKLIDDIFYSITGIRGLHIDYLSNIDLDFSSIDKLKISIKKKYLKEKNKEINQGMTLFGPNRDDFVFYIEDKDMKNFSSQGQQKLAIISLKLAEISIFYEETGEYPVLLLDDIFSELDKYKKNRLIKYLNKDIQVIITSNDTKDISKKLLDDAKIFKIISGQIIEKEGNKYGRN